VRLTAHRNRRALLLLAVAMVLYVAVSQFVLPAYDKLRAAPAQVVDTTDQLRKYRRELLHRGNYETLMADLRKKTAEASQYFFIDPAELQKLVEDNAKSIGVDLAQRSATQSKKVDDLFTEITMTATFEATPSQLVRLLDALRASPKIVNIRTAQIDPGQIAYEAPKTGELKKTVRVNMTIVGEIITNVASAVK
jgi:hypothetical protein